ncbi:MAG: hypothetical protein R3F36_15330, partial [Candidatus Competibacteraceae bacterium]
RRQFDDIAHADVPAVSMALTRSLKMKNFFRIALSSNRPESRHNTYLCVTLYYVLKGGSIMASTTVNFTGALDRDLLKRAKIIAAKSETSVNALLNAQLRYLVETYEAGELAHNENYATLLAFSLGRLDDLIVMQKLGIDSEEDLFLLMAQAHLPMPRLPEAETRKMVETLRHLAE